MTNVIKNNISLIIGLIFILYYLYTFSNALDINRYIVNALLLVIVIYFQTVWNFFYFYKKNGKPRLQDWFRLSIFMMIVLNFMKIINNVDNSANIEFVVGKLSLNNADFTMLVIIFTLLSLDIAYVIHNTFKNNINDNGIYSINHKNWVFGLLILSTIFNSYLLFSGATGFGVKNTSGLISFVSMLLNYIGPFALIISAYIIYIENSKNTLYIKIFYSTLIIQVILGFLSGMKENAIEPILYVVIVFLISGRKISQKFLMISIFFFILLYPINSAYRTVIGTPHLNTGSSVVNMAIAIKIVTTEPLLEILLSGADSYGSRGEMFPFLLYAINIEERWNYYKYMDRYIFIPIVWFIPSGLWEGKPRADIGGVLYELVTGTRTATSITPTTIGWVYFEGGILFIFLIFIILGLIFEFIDNKSIKKPIILLFYIILFHKAIKPEWDPYFMITSLIPMLIIYIGLLKIIGINRTEA